MKLRRVVMGDEEAQAAITVLRAVHGQRILVEHDQDKVAHAIEAIDVSPAVDGDKTELDPRVRQLGKFARKSETSRQGALANYPRSGSQRERVLREVILSGDRGMTREELESATTLGGNTVRPRVRELIDGGWVRVRAADDGAVALRRKTAMGNWSEVLVSTVKAARYAESHPELLGRASKLVPA
jgi:hypothetical protein